MLKKANRIRKTKEYDDIFKTGKSYKALYFVLIVKRNTELENGPKFGFIASKKVGGAVERNRAKRLLREAIRIQLDKFPKDIEASVIAFHSINDKSIEDISKEMEKLIKQLQ
jgi:ribonuclease P protein component